MEVENSQVFGNLTGEDEIPGETIPTLACRVDLLAYLKSLKARTDKAHESHLNPVAAHTLADMAMLKYIHHEEISKVFKKLTEVLRMIKRDELSNPQSCLNRAGDDEMVFVLLARDISAPQTIEDWVNNRVARRKNKRTDPQILDALECAH